jgi:hypothetical protein
MIKLRSLIKETFYEGVIKKGYDRYPEIEKQVLDLLNNIVKGKKSESLVINFDTEFSIPVKLQIHLLASDKKESGHYLEKNSIITLYVPLKFYYDNEGLVNLIKRNLKHEFDHFLQHSFSLDKKYKFGLEKNKIRNKKLDMYGIDKKTGRYTDIDRSTGKSSDYHSFSIEYKPWLKTHITNFKQLVPDSLPLKIKKQLFGLYVGLIKEFGDYGYDEKETEQKLDPELSQYNVFTKKMGKYWMIRPQIKRDVWKQSLRKLKVYDFPRWKQMVKEMYKELFK